MIDSAKIEGYMLSLSLTYETVDDGTWLINDDEKGLENVLVILADPVVIIRVKVMGIPAQQREEFFEQLLRLNQSDMIHGAYALEGDDVILLNTLVGATLDLEEFQATLDAIGLELAQHYRKLARYRDRVEVT
ncbi:MAG: YbjN domain-containing protein [Spirochaetaceae bacterium]|nr:YbjN domain-containing protein [Spirochaetaceae bacterium]